MLEKKTRAETEARLSVEKQLADLQAQKLEEAANAARSLTSRYKFYWFLKVLKVPGELRLAKRTEQTEKVRNSIRVINKIAVM